MATLTRPRISASQPSHSFLTSTIPTPFPAPERERFLLEELEELVAETDVDRQNVVNEQQRASSTKHELLPSIALVQKSCIMTLNNLLSVPTNWAPIVPDRRHSMPSNPQSTPSTHPDTVQSPSSALHTLVSNLRNREELMIESHPFQSDTDMIRELRTRVESLSPTLHPRDAHLGRALISLLSHFDRLSVIYATSSSSSTISGVDSLGSFEPTSGPNDIFDTLRRQLSDLQIERLSHQDKSDHDTPVLVVEKALLWQKIDEELETVLLICKERTDTLPRFFSADFLPPEYDSAECDFDPLPAYHSGIQPSPDSHHAQDSKSRTTSLSSTTAPNEKMRLDLESVTMAIDRLYLVAPQLHNQRVELKSTKVEQMENARRAGEPSSDIPQSGVAGTRKGTRKDSEAKELDGILDLLSKASNRKLSAQSVLLDGDMKARLEKSRLRDMEKRDAFVEQLLHHSGAGRLHSQDAVLSPIPKTKDPNALLTLPEFLRQSIPDSVRLADPNALLTLPEFFREPVPDHVLQPQSTTELKTKKSYRRSVSAPPKSWLRHSTSRSVGSTAEARPLSTFETELTPKVGFDVHYVAENHENLNHVLVFLTITGAAPGSEPEAEVLPSFSDPDDGDRLIIRCGPNTSPPLSLPSRTSPGKKEVKTQNSHYEIKLSTNPFVAVTPAETLPLLDASQLSTLNPINFTCSSCSLPLVRSQTIGTYRDLPSEHWEELVDAWMCHSDQHLHEQIAKGSRGFWPEQGQALVGGSYILFEESSIVLNNLWRSDQTKLGEGWRSVRCLCGAIVGRCQEQQQSGDVTQAMVYRLVKYAIRPVSTTSEPLKIPLSAFIVEDMNEFVQAHATHRFVIFDEEEERPRILIWLFKPNLKIAYTVPVQYAIPKSGSLRAAKVLYKIVGPWAAPEQLKSILNQYPGFPQAEYLYYPLDICRRLARLLKESNSAYPESMRTMTGLEVGWLQRA